VTYVVPRPTPCVACGTEHGSVGGEINCLRAAVLLEREKSADLARRLKDAAPAIAKLAELDRIQREYRAIPVTVGGMFESLMGRR
jgi:hypothetical protein